MLKTDWTFLGNLAAILEVTYVKAIDDGRSYIEVSNEIAEAVVNRLREIAELEVARSEA